MTDQEFTNHFFTLYIFELFSLTKGIITDCEYIFNKITIPEKGHLIIVDPESQYKISSIILQSANVKKLLFPPTYKLNNESKIQQEIRTRRGDRLQDIFKLSGKEEILNIKVRNSYEHFDEKLDKLALKKVKESKDFLDYGMVLYNISLSDSKAFFPTPYYIKTYIAETRTIYNCGKECNIGKIYEEAKSINETIKKQFGSDIDGGLMMRI